MSDPEPPRDGEGGEDPPDTRPFLCIPYWTTPLSAGGTWDTGQQRPLPGTVVYYLCESIRTTAYTPGKPLSVTVEVRNSGGGNAAAIATVLVYWGVPSAGFATLNFFAAATVPVTPSRTAATVARTATMTGIIPADAPDHICLLVQVSHPQDRAPTAFNPVGDRHWAQRNLQAVTVAPGAPAIAGFVAANPFATDGTFDLQVTAADRHQIAVVAASLGAEPKDVRPTLTLLDAEGSPVSAAGPAAGTRFALKGRGQRAFQVLVEVPGELPVGTVGVIEVKLLDAEQEGRVVGGLGIALNPPDRSG